MNQAALLILWWGTVLAIAALTWPGPAAGLVHEINTAATLLAGTVLVNVAAIGAADRRDAVFATVTRSWWLAYFVVTLIIDALSGGAGMAAVLIAHGVNLAVAVAVSIGARRGVRHATGRLEASRVESEPLRRLADAVRGLMADSKTWPAEPARAELDTLVHQLSEAVRYAPSRVPAALAARVEDLSVVVDTTRQRLGRAPHQPPQWYADEVRACLALVSAEMESLTHAVAASRRL